MESQALTVQQDQHLTATEIRAHVNLIQEVMKAVMKDKTHYGIIPGCAKPSLWKPGAEVLFTTFRIAVDPVIEDLSTPEEARFRVIAHATSASGNRLGSAAGEASSDEEKYKWREAVCQEEFEATPVDRRRTKWKSGQRGVWSVDQVRTQVADHRNTILKMATKRAYVGLALQVTAASDIFTQDIEDLPTELQSAAINGDATHEELPTEIKKKEPEVKPQTSQPSPQPTAAPRQQTQARPPVQSPKPSDVRIISEAQARRFFGIWKSAGRDPQEVKSYLKEVIGVSDDRRIPADRYNEACDWAQGN